MNDSLQTNYIEPGADGYNINNIHENHPYVKYKNGFPDFNTHKYMPRDVVGYTLHYYQGDYESVKSGIEMTAINGMNLYN